MKTEYRAKPSEIIDRRSSSAINCFTGAIAYCLQKRQINISERDLLSCGGGFLWRAGLDEYGFPELTFPVEQTGIRALEFMGGQLDKSAIEISLLFKQLCDLLAQGPIICWVNSAYLDYTSLYTQSLGHLHTIVIDHYDETNDVFWVFDPLVVDLPPYACSAKIQPAQLCLALTREVKTDEYDLMGYLIHINHELKTIDTRISLSRCLLEQAEIYFAESQYAQAIHRYQMLNEKAFADSKCETHLKRLARRIFDHGKILYILPSLMIQQQVCEDILDELGIKGVDKQKMPAGRDSLKNEILSWKAIAILALKYEAALSEKVLIRLMDRLQQVSVLRSETWQSILDGLSLRSVNIPQSHTTYTGNILSEVNDDNQYSPLLSTVKSIGKTDYAKVQQCEDGVVEEFE